MIKKLSVYAFALLMATVFFSSCKKDYETVQMVDDGKIADYLAKNNILAVADSAKTGYFYLLENPAPVIGAPAANTYIRTDSVRYNIVIKSLFNGTVYSSSPLTSNLGVLVGYTGGISGKSVPAILDVMQKLKPGGTARIFLPSYLAFGKNGNSDPRVGIIVPANEVLEVVLTTYSQKQADLDDQHIRDFLTANSLTATKDASTGVYYMVTQAGTGDAPIGLKTDVSVNYTFRLLDGTLIQETSAATLFTINEVILGWRVLRNFKKGAKVRIFIPSVSGYGNSNYDPGDNSGRVIAANSCLDYTIEIVDVIN